MPVSRSAIGRYSLIVAVLLATGCALRPLHGGISGAHVNQSLASVEINAPDDRSGQRLFEALSTSLNPDDLSVGSSYRLYIDIERKAEALAIQLDDTETRFDLVIEARYTLRDGEENIELLSGFANQISSYNVVRQPFATLVSEEDSERRAMVGIADQIRNRLALYFDAQIRP